MRLDHLLSKRRVGDGREAEARAEAKLPEVCVSLVSSQVRGLGDLAAIRPGETPVPIPNTTVKPRAADGTELETVWESRRAPEFKKRKSDRFASDPTQRTIAVPDG